MLLKPAETSHTQAGSTGSNGEPYEKSNGSVIRANGSSNDERSNVQKMQRQIAVKERRHQKQTRKTAAEQREENESDQGSDT